ncbi:MAG: hypothetical protein HOG79_06200, partial [Prolixibacteraceae bacterium]|nr:hypothetical protein [Prolixibacteraceae bacterium]
MGENNRIRIVYVGLILLSFNLSLVRAQSNKNDTVIIEGFSTEKKILLNDSLKNKEKKGKLLQLFNDIMISPPRPYVDKKALALDYYSQSEGEIISKIDITALDVFGPSFEDTTKKAKSWIERTSNSIHTKSNLKTIKRLLLFNVGDSVNSELMYENERIIRALPYIKDLKIVLEQDSIFENQIKIHVITKDRFSLGVSGGVNGITSAALEAYNQNIFGVGHEISFRFVGHLQRRPYMGLETFYKINNVRGKFIDISAGYMNTYKKEGYSFILNKPFITPSVKWGYGAS